VTEKYLLTVDRAMCEAHGRCEETAPDIFELDDDERLQIHRPHPGPEDLDRVRRAVRGCPKTALSLTREPHDPESHDPEPGEPGSDDPARR
jgi:ferredoxin